ncbi:hypothetical protein Hanom_Chr11g01016861 [Helianthus anomalus]
MGRVCRQKQELIIKQNWRIKPKILPENRRIMSWTAGLLTLIVGPSLRLLV